MRELTFFETQAVTGGHLSNFEVVLFPALIGGALHATVGALYFGFDFSGVLAFSALGFSIFGGIGLGVVCTAGIIKFARQEISI